MRPFEPWRRKPGAAIVIAGGTLTATLNWSSGSPGMNENEIAAAITKQL